MESLERVVKSKWFSVIYLIGAIGLILYFEDDISKVVFYYVSFFLAIRLLANKKWIQLTILIFLIIAVTVWLSYLKLKK
ncbi:hypothetical protein CSC2_18830 [Clostridium zeae]|uniref:Uncharacterized protein n=1 Tax=Clostridium zeae TaxID=2759022 RepID=A0ABQ1E983_9CLOT|nr:hypothetical protein CSC2_18830 [Clostridium zeae]